MLESIPSCTFSQKVTKSIDQYWPVFVAGRIFCVILLACLIAICCHRKSKKPSTHYHQPHQQNPATKSPTNSNESKGEHYSDWYNDDHEMQSMDDWYLESPRHHEERSPSISQESPEERHHRYSSLHERS